MSYAHLFTGSGRAQTRTDETLIWAGLDWDIHTRSALVVGLLDAESAQVLQGLPPVTGPASLDAVKAAVTALRPKLREQDAAAQAQSGWTLQTPQAAAIVQTLCATAWSAFEGSGHGRAWSAANMLRPDLKVALASADVSLLSRLAARAVTWSVGGKIAVTDLSTFDQSAVKTALAARVAPILAAHSAFVGSL